MLYFVSELYFVNHFNYRFRNEFLIRKINLQCVREYAISSYIKYTNAYYRCSLHP